MLGNLRKEIDLLQRHVRILKLVVENEPIGILKLSDLSGLPQHRVRYSLRVLEQKGIIKPSPHGAVSTAKAKKIFGTLHPEINVLAEKLKKIVHGPTL